MDVTSIGIIGILVLVILILARMPVAAALALVGTGGFAWVVGMESTWGMLQTVPFSTFASQAMSRWPLWFLMLGLCLSSGIAYCLFEALNTWLNLRKTGTALAAMLTAGLFGGTAAFSWVGLKPLTKMFWPVLQKQGYSSGVATGLITAGFSLGILLPVPAMLLIIYGVITEQALGILIWASFLPAVISLMLYGFALAFGVRRQSEPVQTQNCDATYQTDDVMFKAAWGMIIIFVLFVVGTLGGFLAPTQAAALGAFLTLVLTVWLKKLTKRTYMEACQTTLIGTGWFFLLIFGAMIFGYFLTVTRLPYELSGFLFHYNHYLILGCVLVIIVLAGCLLEALALMLLVIPILYPLIFKSGFHPIWFGILSMRCIGLGLMLPFGGLNLRLVQRQTGATSRSAARGVMPFVVADIILILLLTVFPQIVLWPLGILNN